MIPSGVCSFKCDVNAHVFEHISYLSSLMYYICERSPFFWLLFKKSFYTPMFLGDFVYYDRRVIVVL
jgi:hypothetical protein